jgi:hypothetical protein
VSLFKTQPPPCDPVPFHELKIYICYKKGLKVKIRTISRCFLLLTFGGSKKHRSARKKKIVKFFTIFAKNMFCVISQIMIDIFPFFRTTVQNFSFVLTDIDSKWTFGFCRLAPNSQTALVINRVINLFFIKLIF